MQLKNMVRVRSGDEPAVSAAIEAPTAGQDSAVFPDQGTDPSGAVSTFRALYAR